MYLLPNRINKISLAVFLYVFMSSFLLMATSFQLDNFNPNTGTVDVLYDFDEGDVAGFQFDVSGIILSDASGGDAEAAGFTVSSGSSTVLGFSFDGLSIPQGSGILTTLFYSEILSNEACLAEIIATAPGGMSEYSSSAGSCISTDVPLTASLSLGAFDNASGTLEVLYDFGGPVAGFQFDVTGLDLTGASGAAAGDAGMTVSVGGATVLGFSFDNSEILAGAGVLTVLSFSDVTAGTTDLSLGNFGAVTSAAGVVYNTSASDSISHGDPDCAGTYYGDSALDDCGVCDGGNADQDCAGDCFGEAALDDCGVCDGGNADEDCAGVCFGDSALDDCGVCDGGGVSCAETSIDILYSSDVPVAGFQFNVSGPAILSAGGGAAEDAGFTVSTSASVVLGFSFDGATIPAGEGVLTTLVVIGDVSEFSVSGQTLSSSDGMTLDSFIEDNGLVYCSADADADGTCDGLDDCVGAFDDCGV